MEDECRGSWTDNYYNSKLECGDTSPYSDPPRSYASLITRGLPDPLDEVTAEQDRMNMSNMNRFSSTSRRSKRSKHAKTALVAPMKRTIVELNGNFPEAYLGTDGHLESMRDFKYREGILDTDRAMTMLED